MSSLRRCSARKFRIRFPTGAGLLQTLAWDQPGGTALSVAGEVQIVGAADVAERIHQDDAVKPRPILGSTLDFGLVLFIDFRADQGSGFFQLLHAFFKWEPSLGQSRTVVMPGAPLARRPQGRQPRGPQAVPAERAWTAGPGATGASRRGTGHFRRASVPPDFGVGGPDPAGRERRLRSHRCAGDAAAGASWAPAERC